MNVVAQYICNVAFGFWQLLLSILGVKLDETTYLWSFLVCLDMLANAILLGDPRETISSRADKAKKEGKLWGCILCKLLSKIQKKHCQISLEPTEGSKAIIPD